MEPQTNSDLQLSEVADGFPRWKTFFVDGSFHGIVPVRACRTARTAHGTRDGSLTASSRLTRRAVSGIILNLPNLFYFEGLTRDPLILSEQLNLVQELFALLSPSPLTAISWLYESTKRVFLCQKIQQSIYLVHPRPGRFRTSVSANYPME